MVAPASSRRRRKNAAENVGNLQGPAPRYGRRPRLLRRVNGPRGFERGDNTVGERKGGHPPVFDCDVLVHEVRDPALDLRDFPGDQPPEYVDPVDPLVDERSAGDVAADGPLLLFECR